jgi:hypothetical protein
MRVGQARKRDANEKPIVQALERIGVRVRRISEKGFADLVCLSPRTGHVVLLEVKSSSGKLTREQIRYSNDGWPVIVVRSTAEALAVFGVVT